MRSEDDIRAALPGRARSEGLCLKDIKGRASKMSLAQRFGYCGLVHNTAARGVNEYGT